MKILLTKLSYTTNLNESVVNYNREYPIKLIERFNRLIHCSYKIINVKYFKIHIYLTQKNLMQKASEREYQVHLPNNLNLKDGTRLIFQNSV